jgi:hypothetical protein
MKMSETMPEEQIRGSGHVCACVHFDRFVCANMRHNRMECITREEFDPCDCGCHDDWDDEDDF